MRPPPLLRKLPTGDYRQRFLSQDEIRRLLIECDRISGRLPTLGAHDDVHAVLAVEILAQPQPVAQRANY